MTILTSPTLNSPPPRQYRFNDESDRKLKDALTKESSPFSKLPAEIIRHIFNFLPMQAVGQASRACRQFYNHSQNANYWQAPLFTQGEERKEADVLLNRLKKVAKQDQTGRLELWGKLEKTTANFLLKLIECKEASSVHLPTFVAALERLTHLQQFNLPYLYQDKLPLLSQKDREGISQFATTVIQEMKDAE